MPLTYTLTIKACLSADASERPTYAQLEELLADMRAEVHSGHYISSKGQVTVRAALPVGLHTRRLLLACGLRAFAKLARQSLARGAG